MCHSTIGELRDRQQSEERELVRDALASNRWSITDAARSLHVQVSTLQSMIERHGLGELYKEHAPGKAGRPPKSPAVSS